jgi:hypothetical protein
MPAQQINDQYQVPRQKAENSDKQKFDDFKLFVLRVADWMELNRRQAENNERPV